MTKKLQHGLIAVLLGSLSTLGSAAAFAQASGETQNPLPGPIQKVLTNYLGGKAFCQQYPDVTGKETSFRVTVPVDYKNPAAGTTEIYAFLSTGAYDPTKPTMINFDGGPGGNSHTVKKITSNYNEIYFDERGIGCSRPEDINLFKSPHFYSSENNARDAEEIRKFMKIDKLSVYGASYGTVPATIYASLFPQNTTALVLDGVLFSEITDDNTNVVNFYLTQTYKSLPEATKQAMKSYFADEEKSFQLWQLARMAMYGNRGFDVLKKLLVTVFPDADHIVKDKADQYFDPGFSQKAFFGQDSITNIEMMNYEMINCQEFRSKELKVLLLSSAGDGDMVMVPYTIDTSASPTCDALGAAAETQYVASNYPVKVPVTYFQGTWDGATVAAEAVRHYKTVPQGPAQILLAVKGGHAPNYIALSDPSSPGVQYSQQIVFEQALAGKTIGKNQVSAMNQINTVIRWTYASKNVK